jgi:hypothetical protein
MIAPIRVAGTRNAMARAFTDMPIGSRNSSRSTSPGWLVTRLGVAIRLVVIDDFDIGRPFFRPSKTNAPLVVDPDRVLPVAVCREHLQSVSWRRPQIAEIARDMQHIELSLCLFLDPAEPLHESAGPDAPRWRGRETI